MPKLFDLVKVNTATTGTGTITFGAAFSNAFLTPSEAGCVDADTVRYVLVDGTDVEVGEGAIGGSATTMTRTVLFSKISGTKGTSKINLSGTAYVYFTAISSDLVSIDGANGAFTTDDSLSSASNVLRAQFKGHLNGLTLSNNATDATNDIDIAAGEAADADGNLMVLAFGITKRLDGAWFPGSGSGGMESGGSLADGTWHVWLIQRSDTGAVDVLFSASATSPTMPASYDRKRRIGSIIRASGAILAFRQHGDVFKLASSVTDYSSTGLTTDALVSLTVPNGIGVRPLLTSALQRRRGFALSQPPGEPRFGSQPIQYQRDGSILHEHIEAIRFSMFTTAASVNTIVTSGWFDDRGR